MQTNISTTEDTAALFRLLGQPVRLQILLLIGTGEACVCHIEAALNRTQAGISQHLMALRKAGLVSTRRGGRNIFYRLTIPGIIPLLHQAAQTRGLFPAALDEWTNCPIPGCPCPRCSPIPTPCNPKPQNR